MALLRALRLAFAFVALVVTVLVGACASGPTEGKQSPSAIAFALSAGAKDTRLVDRLKTRAPGDGWERDGRGWTSSGWRSTGLAARLAEHADEAFDVGVDPSPELRLRLTPLHAERVTGTLQDGLVVYAGAYGAGVDVVMSTTRGSVEELFVMREPVERATFAWDVTLPSGITAAVDQPDGSLELQDVRGESVLVVPSAYALDARGVRREARLSWDRDAHRLGVELEAQGLAFPVLLDPAFEVPAWKLADSGAPMASPQAYLYPSMAYDALRDKVVLFGGQYGATILNETWTWDGTAWTKQAVAAPTARELHAMAYDAARGKIVLFGGAGAGGTKFGDTWTWDGTTWTNVTPALPQDSPSARWGMSMAYDAARGKIVLFGGNSGTNETWQWDGTKWTMATPVPSPSARTQSAMAYDAARGKVVLFGGSSGGNETWLWDGTSWTAAAPVASPTARASHAMVYDAARGKVLLNGGSSGTAETWTWDGTTWAQATPSTSPPNGSGHAMAYDTTRGKVVRHGGSVSTAGTWLWNGTTWHDIRPLDRAYAAAAYDAARAKVVAFGGLGATYFGDTLTWQGTSWARAFPAASPPPRAGHEMAYDAARAKIVLFGGANSTGTLGDTWTWDGATWAAASPATSPSARSGHAMAFDAARSKVVLFGGTTAGGPLGDTWLWDGTAWTPISPATSPLARSGASMAYDAARGKVVLFGGTSDGFNSLGDTWIWDGATWTQALPATSPAGRINHRMAYDTARGKTVLWGGQLVGATGDKATYTWDGSTWTTSSTAIAPAARFSHTMAYDGAHTSMVLFAGSLITGGATVAARDTWRYYTYGGSCATAAECGTGYCVDGVCCQVATCGTCERCDGSSPGTCTPRTSAPDPDSCTGTKTCDANGLCKAALGQPCSAGAECAQGICADGVCCDTACKGSCQACTAALKASGPDGTCGDAKAGLDPHGDCPDDGAASCQRNGSCDGTGRCQLYGGGVACGLGVTCSDNAATGLVCNGLGACGNGTVRCVPYVCTDKGCLTSCNADTECEPFFTCNVSSHTCVPRTGASCDGDHTLTAPDNTTNDCAPYKCEGSTCKTTCNSILDCAYPNECAQDTHTCVPPLSATGPESGCSAAPARSGSSRGGLALTAAMAIFLVRRRRQQARASSPVRGDAARP